MKKLNLISTSFILAAVAFGAVGIVSAQTENTAGLTSASISATTTGAVKLSAKVQAKMTKMIQVADKEIGRRIDTLNKLIERVNNIKKIADTDKGAISANIQSEIASMNTLKAKIDGNTTDVEALGSDVKSITSSYRIFALVIPQGHIMASVDSINTVADKLAVIATKLQTRLAEGTTAGKDMSKLEAKLADMNTKIADVRTQGQAARDIIAPLVPDEGDKTKMEANKTALTTARKDIKTAETDLKSARKSADEILKGLKALGLSKSASASSTAPAVLQ
ncbi:MAG: hypothetical protein WCT19_00720 [Candidatus Paceibacterota bacterium]